MNDDYLSEISNNLAASISKQKDNIIYACLKDNGADIFDLTKLVKECKFVKEEGNDYTMFNYRGRDLLMIFEPEITCENNTFKVEVKYTKLY